MLAARVHFTPNSRSLLPQIHISKAEAPEEDPDPRVVGKAVKLMHRFDPDQIEAKMDQVEGR